MIKLRELKARYTAALRDDAAMNPAVSLTELGTLIELVESAIAWETAKRDADVIRRHLGDSQIEQLRNVVSSHDRDESKCRERYLNALDKVRTC